MMTITRALNGYRFRVLRPRRTRALAVQSGEPRVTRPLQSIELTCRHSSPGMGGSPWLCTISRSGRPHLPHPGRERRARARRADRAEHGQVLGRHQGGLVADHVAPGSVRRQIEDLIEEEHVVAVEDAARIGQGPSRLGGEQRRVGAVELPPALSGLAVTLRNSTSPAAAATSTRRGDRVGRCSSSTHCSSRRSRRRRRDAPVPPGARR